MKARLRAEISQPRELESEAPLSLWNRRQRRRKSPMTRPRGEGQWRKVMGRGQKEGQASGRSAGGAPEEERLWQRQKMFKFRVKDMADYQLTLSRENDARLKSKCGKLADAFVDDIDPTESGGNCIVEEDHEVKSESDSVTMNQQEREKPVEEKEGDDKVDDLVNGVFTDDDATHIEIKIGSDSIPETVNSIDSIDVQSNQYNGILADSEMDSKLVGKSLDVVSGLKSETNVSSDSISVVESNPAEKTCGVTNGGIQFGSFDDEAERETPFNYMIRVLRNDDERLEVMIRLAQNKVEEKIRIRDMIGIDTQSTWVTCEEYGNDFSAAVSQERVARDLHRSKCQEIEWMQSVMDIEDIDVRE
ncbi:hypothetical protein J1N35_028203 [Gossypium stocksii]|uniref:Uncharacterized protein n=1 Tax=Gossypium stocksii TaxID=47602 RepID=A0A9D3ZQW1_9ROSI|nr:hypothetical protein J1N35_028203 [Gossypium stocksii]